MDGTTAFVDTWAGATVRHVVEHVAKLSAGNVGNTEPYAGLDLRYADLRGIDLSGLKLMSCNFSYACLADANLRDTVLHDARMDHTDLCGADLSRAQMRHTVAYMADFRHTQLLDADLLSAHLVGSDFRGADNVDSCCWVGSALRGCNFADQPWPESTEHEHLPFLANHIEEMDLLKHWMSLASSIKLFGWPGRTWNHPPSKANVKRALRLLGALIFCDAASNDELAAVARQIPLRLHPQALTPDPAFLLAVRRSRNKFHPVAATNAVHDMREVARQAFAEIAEDLRPSTDPEWYSRDYMKLQRRIRQRANSV